MYRRSADGVYLSIRLYIVIMLIGGTQICLRRRTVQEPIVNVSCSFCVSIGLLRYAPLKMKLTLSNGG